jgi:uroporphyrinogen decarboxylase
VRRFNGIDVEMKPNFGPYLLHPIRKIHSRCEKVIVPMFTKLGCFDAIKLTKEMLNDEVPLIGFAGLPLTLYMR